uniref:hypothetical protein n=1 Tax=Rhodococcus erythropolis TaxID=1833 RepID=UPI000BB3136B|nr:hypothetical protein [Rhodococcus erythropolis]
MRGAIQRVQTDHDCRRGGGDAEPGLRRTGASRLRISGITYLHTNEGWLHLATALYLATPIAVGWQTTVHMLTSLIVDALAPAVTGRRVSTGAVFIRIHGSHCTAT